jgi:hypothetical protein
MERELLTSDGDPIQGAVGIQKATDLVCPPYYMWWFGAELIASFSQIIIGSTSFLSTPGGFASGIIRDKTNLQDFYLPVHFSMYNWGLSLLSTRRVRYSNSVTRPDELDSGDGDYPFAESAATCNFYLTPDKSDTPIEIALFDSYDEYGSGAVTGNVDISPSKFFTYGGIYDEDTGERV